MKKTKSILGKKKCYGCAVCVDVCPSNAIELKLDENGFLQPQIDLSVCLNCGLCSRFCLEQKEVRLSNEGVLRMYAAWSLEPEVREGSASGGAFSQIAISFLRKGGRRVVFAAGHFESDVLHHEMFFNDCDFVRWQNSKYVQSDMSGTYKKVYNKLKEGYLVLFSGTPCQVFALNLYLIGKSYDGTLFTIDIVCHGVPSYKLIEMSSRLTGSSISKFRTKDAGWGLEAKRVVYKSGVVSKKHSDDVFYLMFESDRFLRKSCYTCPFSRLPRVGDLSIGDYWGDLSFLKKEDVEKGVSLVLRNTEKGDRLLAIVEHSINKIETRNIEDVLLNNPNVFTNSSELAEISDSDKLWLVKYFDFRYVREFLVFGKIGGCFLNSKKRNKLMDQKKTRVKNMVSNMKSGL